MSAGVVLARTLGPAGFGQLALVLAIAAASATLANMGGTETLVRYLPELRARGRFHEAWRVALPFLAVRLAVALIAGLVLIVLHDTIGGAIGLDGSLTLLLASLAAGHALLASLQGPAQVFLVNVGEHRFINTVSAVFSGLYLLALVLFTFSGGLSVEIAVMATTASLAARVAFYGVRVWLVRRSDSKDARQETDGAIDAGQDVRRRMARYSGTMFLIAVGGFLLQSRSDEYFIGAVLGVQAVAFYHLADGFTRTVYSLPMPRLTGFLITGLLAEAYITDGLETVRRRFSRIVRFRFMVNVPIAFGGALLAEEIVATVYGPDYAGAASLLALFFLLQLPLRWIGAISGVLVAVEKPHWFLWTKLVSVVTIPLTIWWLGLWGLNGALFATSLGTAAVAAIEFRAARRFTGISFPAVEVARYVLAGGVMAVAVAGTKELLGGLPAPVVLAVAAPVAGGAYVAALIGLRALSPSEAGFVRSVLRIRAARRPVSPANSG